ncbi:MAG TPA: WYL domain-containing protein [Acidimicrobiia bacterium]|nr:WYL domain-containing protein [Acidimicrobiia bacterium]
MSSPRTAERLSRLLAMLPWVIAHPGAPVDEVCERFGYTRSELVRDLELVFVCGLPGYGPGDLMDAWIDGDEVVVDAADYFSRPVRLTPSEALMMLAGGMALRSSGLGPPALDGAIEKLQRVLLPEGETLAVELESEPALVEPLRRAVADTAVVDIEYTAIASGRETSRAIEPWAVFSTLGNWYVRAHCRLAGEERVFRIDRIRSLEPTGERFDPPDDVGEPIVHYTPGVDDVTAVIRLDTAASWVAEYYPVDVVDVTADGTTVAFSATDAAVAARLLLRLGDRAELLSGDEVAAARDALRSRILARYPTG